MENKVAETAHKRYQNDYENRYCVFVHNIRIQPVSGKKQGAALSGAAGLVVPCFFVSAFLYNTCMKKVAVVTGGAKGLGREIATYLIKDGWDVAIHFHNSEKEAKEVGPNTFGADLKDDQQVKKLAGDVVATFGRVDLLVNNVGNFLYKKFEETSNEEFRDVITSNVYSTLFCSRAFLPVMRKQKSGSIVNLGCVGADRITIRENSVPYFMAKTDVYFLTKIMAYEEAKNGVRINMISPASLAEDIFKASDFPMGRSAKYEDVLGALKFLLSDDAKYVSGANIEVAGAFVPGID